MRVQHKNHLLRLAKERKALFLRNQLAANHAAPRIIAPHLPWLPTFGGQGETCVVCGTRNRFTYCIDLHYCIWQQNVSLSQNFAISASRALTRLNTSCCINSIYTTILLPIMPLPAQRINAPSCFQLERFSPRHGRLVENLKLGMRIYSAPLEKQTNKNSKDEEPVAET